MGMNVRRDKGMKKISFYNKKWGYFDKPLSRPRISTTQPELRVTKKITAQNIGVMCCKIFYIGILFWQILGSSSSMLRVFS